jgi:hypothetical protein
MSETKTVHCPCCGAALQIDPEACVVVSHQPPPDTSEKIDLETRLKMMEEQKRRATDRMAEAMRAEESKGKILEDRFKSLMEKAGEADDGKPPVRDIDLD